jgi:hypothetical protein
LYGEQRAGDLRRKAASQLALSALAGSSNPWGFEKPSTFVYFANRCSVVLGMLNHPATKIPEAARDDIACTAAYYYSEAQKARMRAKAETPAESKAFLDKEALRFLTNYLSILAGDRVAPNAVPGEDFLTDETFLCANWIADREFGLPEGVDWRTEIDDIYFLSCAADEAL